MKKTIALFLVLALFTLTGCESAGEKKERTVDTARSFTRYYHFTWGAETEDTVYFMGDDDIFIKYVDKATGIAGPLCGKPECKHNDENCNAYTYLSDCLIMGGDRLYWICDTQEDFTMRSLFSAALDGTDRREEARYSKDWFGKGYSTFPWYIYHDGYIYYGAQINVIENGEMNGYNYVCALPIDPDEEPFVILNEKTAGDYNLTMQYYDGYLYIITNDRVENQETDRPRYDFRIRRWNVETQETETLYEDLNSPYHWTMELWVTDEYVYFDREDYSKIYRYDFKTGECGEFFDFEQIGLGLGIADNIVVGCDKVDGDTESYELRIRIKDFDGNILIDDTYSLKPEFTKFGTPMLLGRDENYVYCVIKGSEETDTGINRKYTGIIQVALDGSGAKVLCETVGK